MENINNGDYKVRSLTSLAEEGPSGSSESGFSSGFLVAFAGFESPGVEPGGLAPLKLENWK